MINSRNWTPYGENVLVRMCAPPTPAKSLIVRPDTAESAIAHGPAFVFSKKGTTARVLAVGPSVSEVAVGNIVLVDCLAGEPVAELDGDAHEKELRMIREPAVVAVLDRECGACGLTAPMWHEACGPGVKCCPDCDHGSPA